MSLSVREEFRQVGVGVVSRVTRAGQRAGRTAPFVLGIRLLSAAAVVVAAAGALPTGGLATLLGYVVVAAVAVAGFPRTAAVTVVTLAVIGAWLVRTVVFGEAAEGWRVGVVAACLYLAHASAAVAAVLPYDCVVSPRVVVRWAGRCAGVVGATLALAIGGTALVGALPEERSLIGPVVGSVVAVAMAVLLAWPVGRRQGVASEE
jgi:hypothetical protein